MLMGEVDIKAFGLTDKHAETMDDLIPDWRDMTPVEFADTLPEVHAALRTEADMIRRYFGGGSG